MDPEDICMSYGCSPRRRTEKRTMFDRVIEVVVLICSRCGSACVD